MEYRATARYADQTYHGHIAGHDHDAVLSVLKQLPTNRNEYNVVLIVHYVYKGNVDDVVYVTTESKYQMATRNP
jgi:hypothetical protein